MPWSLEIKCFPQKAQEKGQFRAERSSGPGEPEQQVRVTPENCRGEEGAGKAGKKMREGLGLRLRKVSHSECSGWGASYSVTEA